MIKTCTYNKSPVESISSDENKWDPPFLKQPPILPPFLSEKSEPSFLRKFEKRDHSPPPPPPPPYKTLDLLAIYCVQYSHAVNPFTRFGKF